MTQNSKFAKKEAALNYVVVFFLSLEHFSAECYEVEAIKTLLKDEIPKQIFANWWHIRDAVLLIQNMTGNPNVSLRDFFLTSSGTLVLIERVKNKEAVKKAIQDWIASMDTEIKQLRKDIRKGKQLSKAKLEKLEKHFKVGKVCAAPVALKLLNYFIEEVQVEKSHAA